jgi:hypothetical protein
VKEGDFEIVTLRNGARAVRHLGHGEVMHPSVGPWKEANLLYVEQPRLGERLTIATSEPLRVFDVGLGAATNAVAALHCARSLWKGQGRPLEMTSFEVDLSPLRLALEDPEGFSYLVPFREAARALIEIGTWEEPAFRWRLFHGDVLEALPSAEGPAELVYFDPFSPKANPGLWTRKSLGAVRGACGDQALLLTYSAATPTRVALLLAGFYVGFGSAIGTKSETTVAATDLSNLAQPLDARWLERWKRSSARGPHGEELTPAMERQLLDHPQWVR